MIYPVLYIYNSESTEYDNVYQYFVDENKLIIRVWVSFNPEDSTPQANLSLEDTYNTNILSDGTEKIIEYKDKFWYLAGERQFDKTKQSDSQKFGKQILFGVTNQNNISLATSIDTRSDTAYFQKPALYFTYFGLQPLVIIHSFTKEQSLTNCCYTLYGTTQENVITNIPISHVVSPEEQILNHTEGNYMDITSLYCIPEIESSEVTYGDSFELTMSTWCFNASVDTIRPTSFDNAYLDTSINRTIFITVICDGYANTTYAVNIVNGIGSISIPTSQYKVGDVLRFSMDVKFPSSLNPVQITLI